MSSEVIEIVCVLDNDGVRRCFSIAEDRSLMPLCPTTVNVPTTDLEWYNELVKQVTVCENMNCPPMVRT